MKTLLKNLWVCRKNVLIAWILFFCLGLAAGSAYNIFTVFLISVAFAIGVTLLGVFYVKSGWYK
jgi:hypothetical protein